MGWGAVFLAGIGGLGVAKLLGSFAGKKKTIPGCTLTTEEALYLTNQAFASNNPQYVQATAHALDESGCTNEGNAIRKYLADNGYNPDIAIVPANMAGPLAGPGEVTVQPGETWRAAAVLGAIGCAVSLDTIREKVQEKGFTQVSVYSKNPGWGSSWDSDAGFLECTRYIQATVVGKVRAEKKPKQVYRLERVSVAT